MATLNVFDSQDPATALEKAVELNRVKTGEASQLTIHVEHASSEKSHESTSEEIDPKGSASFPAHHIYGEKILISLADCKGELASNLPESKKWITLFIVWLVQISMNFNTSLYSNAIPGISKQFNVNENIARWGAASFLITYAFGCELWAPWSEELGRYWVLEASLGLVNVLQFGVVFAKNIGMVLAFRSLGGLSTAGGSITLGMVADMWDKEHHQAPVAFVVFASVGGSVLGPIVGGLIEQLASWKWAIWVQLIFGSAVQLLHFFFVPETRATILMDRVAKRRRAEAWKEGKYLNLWGPNEITPFRQRFSWTEIFATWIRPFRMFVTEPIVLCLSLLSGFSDALIFMFIQSFGLVYKQWGFTSITIGLAFLPFLVGYIIAWISWVPIIRRNKKERIHQPSCERAQFESRLWWLLYLAPCLPIGLIGFAWTSGGPPVHWIGSMVFTCLCGIANYAIYMATIDYMVTAYGPYSASATGGNGWARDFLAGVLTPAALPFYNIPFGENHIECSGTILAAVATILVACVFMIYRYGPQLREKSPFAQKLKAADQEPEQRERVGITWIPNPGYGTAPCSPKISSDLTRQFQLPLQPTASRSEEILHSRVGFSRQASPSASCHPSRANSPTRGLKRPSQAPRAKSMYHNEREAAKINVDPLLLCPPRPGFAASHNYHPTSILSATRSEQHLGADSANANQRTVIPSTSSKANSSNVDAASESNDTAPAPGISFSNSNWTQNQIDPQVANPSGNDNATSLSNTGPNEETQPRTTPTNYDETTMVAATDLTLLSPKEAPGASPMHMPRDPLADS